MSYVAASANATTSSTTSKSLALPSWTHAAGQKIFLACAAPSTTYTVTAGPSGSGWTLVTQFSASNPSSRLFLWVKDATSGDPGTTITWTTSSGLASAHIAYVVDDAGAIDFVTTNHSSGTTVSPPKYYSAKAPFTAIEMAFLRSASGGTTPSTMTPANMSNFIQGASTATGSPRNERLIAASKDYSEGTTNTADTALTVSPSSNLGSIIIGVESLSGVSTNVAPTVTVVATVQPYKKSMTAIATVTDPQTNMNGLDTHTFAWNVVSKPFGSTLTIDDTTSTVTFTPDKIGEYTVRCVATDPEGATGEGTDTFTITPIMWAKVSGSALPATVWVRQNGVKT